ncbi:MAG: hypothetical protein ACP5R5_09705 [Armatimonadota bacterium]
MIEVDIAPDSEEIVLTREMVESPPPRSGLFTKNPCAVCGRQVPEGELYCVECTPAREESQDARNAGPILVALLLLCLVLALVIVFAAPGLVRGPDDTSPPTTNSAPHGVGR